MKIKRYFAKDMRLALQQVKEELGADAVIMSNKKIAGGVEIVAAVDGDSDPIERRPPPSAPVEDNYSQASMPRKRELSSDKVSLGQGHSRHAEGHYHSEERGSELTKDEMSRQFANMLKRYQEQEEQHQSGMESEADSLAGLMERQNRTRSRPSGKPERSDLSREAGLSKLITENRDVRPKPPKLDPTRYDRKQRRYEEQESQKELEDMREEISSIRRLLEHQVSGLMWQEVERREPLRAMLIKRLENMGLSPELSDQLACYIPEDTEPRKAWSVLLSLLADQITTSRVDPLKEGGVIALLGPTGVGKTTTVAKLAARAAMEYGPEDVALVTTDTYRIGAHEQLSIYGRIMGCAVRVAKNSDELADVLYQLRHRHLVLVDTAGMGQRDVRLSEQLDTLMHDSGEIISSYLVMPATAQRQVLQETLDHFKRIPLAGCILTKLDESLSVGEFISVAIHNSLPVSYVANGQRVPEDIVLAQPKYLVAKADELLDKSSKNDPHFWNSDMDEY